MFNIIFPLSEIKAKKLNYFNISLIDCKNAPVYLFKNKGAFSTILIFLIFNFDIFLFDS